MEENGLIPAVGTARQTVTGRTAPVENPWSETVALFCQLNAYLENPPRTRRSLYSHAAEEWEEMEARFIGPVKVGSAAKAPVIWYNSVKPTQVG